MAQTIRSAVFEVRAEAAALLAGRIGALRAEEEATEPNYARLCAAVPTLHFLALTVFPDAHHDPVLVLEANFDGPPGPFFAALEAAIGGHLRGLLRCCKRPRDRLVPMFDAVVAEGSRVPVAPYLEARARRPAVGHQGNRGLDRARIEREAALFAAAQEQLEPRADLIGLDAPAIHRRLRDALLPRFPWLAEAPPSRIPYAEHRDDWWRLGAFVAAALVALLFLPVVAVLLLPRWLVLALSVVLAGAALYGLRDDLRRLGEGPARPAAGAAAGAPRPFPWRAALAAAAVLAFLALALPGVLVVLIATLAELLGLALWLRALEARDPPQDAPVLDEAAMAEMARREDQLQTMNHMGSVVLIKPGILRAVLIRAGLVGLGLLLRVLPEARAGWLSSMRTIHFAHWAIIGNGGRLMFFSNFDGTWESYLDDFIEKAHGGLTLAWCNCVGFPPARFLWLDGATNGRRFKEWARHSMRAAGFWMSAYPRHTVEQIERHHAVALGLARPRLSPQEATAWTRCL